MSTKKAGTKYIDYLDEDDPIPGQSWVCISFLSPEGIKNCTTRGLKIRGVYQTREQADRRADELAKTDPDFDVFVGEVGKWLPWDPDPNSAEDQVYQEEQLNDLMKGHKDNLEKAKRMQAQRKKDYIAKAAREEQSKKNKTKNRLKKKLEEKQARESANRVIEEVSNSDDLDETEKLLEKEEKQGLEERKRLNNTERTMNETTSNISTIDQKLEKIQSLYNKMTEKQKSAST